MKLNDINETVFQTLSPEVQDQLIRSAANTDMNNVFFAAIVIIAMLAFTYFSIKEIR